MKRLLLPLLAAIALPTAVNANVDPEVHKLCLPAADYLGCVKAMTTKPADIPSLRLIEGATELTGNSCPTGYAYAGAGQCRLVEWNIRNYVGVDHLGLASAGWIEVKGLFGELWAFKFTDSIKAVVDPSCPNKEPFKYTRSSCEERPKPPEIQIMKKWVRRIKTKDLPRWDIELERAFGIPNLATDARNYKKPPSNPNVSTGSIKINCDSPVWKNKPRCN